MTLAAIGKLITSILNAVNPFFNYFRSLTTSGTGEVIKAAGGYVHTVNIVNTAASIIYLKFYNKATAASASDVPVLVLAVPTAAGSTVLRDFVKPHYFSTGISVRCVTGVADNDNTGPGTSPIVEIKYV